MNDSTPLLGSNTGNSDDKDQRSIGMFFKNVLRSGLVAPSRTTYSSISALLNEEDTEKRDRLTEKWRDHKLQELNFIGVVGALLAGVLTSTGSWPPVLSTNNSQPWAVRAFWFCGIIFALFSVLIAAQQSLRLHRLSAHRDGLAYIRSSMRPNDERDHGGRLKPRAAQVYAWQLSIALLTAAVFCMVGGITVLLWISTSWGPYRSPTDAWWDDSAKLAVTFTVVLVGTLTLFLAAQASLSVGYTLED